MEGRQTMPDPPQQDDILRWLMAVNLTDREEEFRAILENIAENPDSPKMRDMVIATAATLMSCAGVGWPIVMRTMTQLSRLSDEDLQQGAVAIVNGDYLILPAAGDRVRRIDLGTLRDATGDMPPAFVSTVFSLTAIWEHLSNTL